MNVCCMLLPKGKSKSKQNIMWLLNPYPTAHYLLNKIFEKNTKKKIKHATAINLAHVGATF